MLPLAILLLAMPHPNGVADPITYSTVAAPMKRVFAELSEKTGVQLAVSKELENEPLILDVHDVTLSFGWTFLWLS